MTTSGHSWMPGSQGFRENFHFPRQMLNKANKPSFPGPASRDAPLSWITLLYGPPPAAPGPRQSRRKGRWPGSHTPGGRPLSLLQSCVSPSRLPQGRHLSRASSDTPAWSVAPGAAFACSGLTPTSYAAPVHAGLRASGPAPPVTLWHRFLRHSASLDVDLGRCHPKNEFSHSK